MRQFYKGNQILKTLLSSSSWDRNLRLSIQHLVLVFKQKQHFQELDLSLKAAKLSKRKGKFYLSRK